MQREQSTTSVPLANVNKAKRDASPIRMAKKMQNRNELELTSAFILGHFGVYVDVAEADRKLKQDEELGLEGSVKQMMGGRQRRETYIQGQLTRFIRGLEKEKEALFIKDKMNEDDKVLMERYEAFNEKRIKEKEKALKDKEDGRVKQWQEHFRREEIIRRKAMRERVVDAFNKALEDHAQKALGRYSQDLVSPATDTLAVRTQKAILWAERRQKFMKHVEQIWGQQPTYLEWIRLTTWKVEVECSQMLKAQRNNKDISECMTKQWDNVWRTQANRLSTMASTWAAEQRQASLQHAKETRDSQAAACVAKKLIEESRNSQSQPIIIN